VPESVGNLEGIDALAELFAYQDVAVLTGAGCSTASGIPDYRGPKTRDNGHEPMTYREFTRSPAKRRQYWARSMAGWPNFRSVDCNQAHRAIAELEADGAVTGVITQNVDRLHHRAGSSRIVELHGALAEVRCLECGELSGRDAMQERLAEANAEWAGRVGALRPDGDVELPDAVPQDFCVPDCRACGGTLKPDIVFFGENVADEVVTDAWSLLYDADALLVVGSSLTVWSGYRFVRKAAQRRMPIGIINIGETRGDEEAWVKVDARAGEAMRRLADAL
jgi:NAD-dependent SIR2 family protein deacetylase